MCQAAIYPGTFDPVTYGHLDLIRRAVGVFGEVTVAVAANPHKKPLFSMQERVKLLQRSTADFPGVTVESFHGLVVDYAHRKKAKVLIRGLRMLSDFEYEFQMALTNRKFNPEVETIFLMPQDCYSYLSSKLLREAVSLGADVSFFVPDFVQAALKKKIGNR